MEDRLRLHRRLLRLDGRALTVLTLQPGSAARYATNEFHGTPHVLTDVAGAQMLGRLLWGLAYQRRPQTAVLIDRSQLDPNPFDAEPSVPVLFAVADRTVLDTAMLRALRRALPLTGAPDGTATVQTPGLDVAVRELRTWREAPGRPPTSARPIRCEPGSDPSGSAVTRPAQRGRGGALVTFGWAIAIDSSCRSSSRVARAETKPGPSTSTSAAPTSCSRATTSSTVCPAVGSTSTSTSSFGPAMLPPPRAVRVPCRSYARSAATMSSLPMP
jgi:hypothetical protein